MANGSSIWIPWLAKELEKRGHRVWHPTMPDSDHPKLKDWLAKFEETVAKTDRPLIIIGHSLGGALALKLLEEKHDWTSRLVKTIVLAPPTYLSTKAPDFFEITMNWEGIRQRDSKLTAVWSTDDDRIPERHIHEIEKETKAKTIILENYGHFLFDRFDWLLEEFF